MCVCVCVCVCYKIICWTPSRRILPVCIVNTYTNILYSVIQNNGLNLICLHFLNYKRYVNVIHNI